VKKVLLYISFLFLLQGCVKPTIAQNTLYVVKIVGQSNIGRAKLADLPSYLNITFPNSYILDGANVVPFHVGVNQQDIAGDWGATMQLAYRLSVDFADQDFCFVKHMKGATDLCSDWKAPSGVQYLAYKAKDLAFKQWFANQLVYDSYKVINVFWKQGESDANTQHANGNCPIDYGINEIEFISNVTEGDESIVVWNGGIHYEAPNHPNRQLVNDQKKANPLTKYVSCDSFSVKPNDKVHHNANGCIAMGDNWADCINLANEECENYGVLRYWHNGWEILNNNRHKSKGLVGITVKTYEIDVLLDTKYIKKGVSQITLDEKYATLGFEMGCSAGLDYVRIRASRNGTWIPVWKWQIKGSEIFIRIVNWK